MTPKINQYYFHFKHFIHPSSDPFFHSYKVIGIAGDAHNNQYHNKSVIYVPTFEGNFTKKRKVTCYSRPLAEFTEIVEAEGGSMPRFSLITDSEIISQLQKFLEQN